MNIFYTMYYYTKALLTDKMTIFLKIGSPIIMMIILGVALGGEFSADTLGTCRIGIVADDDIAKIVFDNTDNDHLKLVRNDSVEDAKREIDAGKLDAAIHVSYSMDELNSDKKAEIVTYRGENSEFKQTVIESAVNDLKNISNLFFAVDTDNVNRIYEDYSGQKQILSESKISMDDCAPSAMDYYGVTMLVITLLSGAAFASDYFGSIYLGSIGMRMKSSCVKVYENYIGMYGSMFLVNAIQGLVTMLIMKYICGVNWGSRIGMNVIIILSASAMATSIGMIICVTFSDMKRASQILNMLLQAFAFVAGGYIKLDFGFLKYLSPNYYVQSALFNNIYNGNRNFVNVCLALCWIITIAGICLSVIFTRRRKKYVISK